MFIFVNRKSFVFSQVFPFHKWKYEKKVCEKFVTVKYDHVLKRILKIKILFSSDIQPIF